MSRSTYPLQVSVFILLAAFSTPTFAASATQSLDELKMSQSSPTKKSSSGRVVLDRLEASVNPSIILLSDIKKFREIVRLRGQLDPLFSGTPLAAKGTSASDKEIVDFLINERLITQQFPKTDSDVEQEINSIQTNNHLDRAGLKSALEREGYKFSDYFDLIRGSSSKRDLIDRDIRTKVTISDDDIKNYFYNHYTRGTAVPRAYDLRMISISSKSYKSPGLARQAAEEALKSIRKDNEPFEEVAKRVSDDANASVGGELGILKEDQMSPAIRDQVKKLQIGKVSDVFGSSDRFYILKLVGVQSSESDQLEKMKEEIRAQLAAAEYQHQIGLWLERQRQTAFIHRAGGLSVKEIPTAP